MALGPERRRNAAGAAPPAETSLAPDGRPWSVVLAAAGRDELARLVPEHLARFSERDVLQALRHPYLSRGVIEEVVASKRYASSRAVRKAIARHPLTPRHVALHALEDLPWRELMEIGRDVRTPPPVRRSANLRIMKDLPRLATGELVALARFADTDLIGVLLARPEPAVLSALLNNPRLTPEALVAWITTGEPDAKRLELVASDRIYRDRPLVRLALLRHPRTPRAVALGLLSRGSRTEWGELLEDPRVDPLLSACVARLLENPIAVDRRLRDR